MRIFCPAIAVFCSCRSVSVRSWGTPGGLDRHPVGPQRDGWCQPPEDGRRRRGAPPPVGGCYLMLLGKRAGAAGRSGRGGWGGASPRGRGGGAGGPRRPSGGVT